MKKLSVILLALFSMGAIAAEVKVTSFTYTGQQSRTAELCGVVTGHSDHAHVRVAVDPKTNKPGIYNTLTGRDGKFCVVVVTYSGTAEASLFDETEVVEAKIK